LNAASRAAAGGFNSFQEMCRTPLIDCAHLGLQKCDVLILRRRFIFSHGGYDIIELSNKGFKIADTPNWLKTASKSLEDNAMTKAG